MCVPQSSKLFVRFFLTVLALLAAVSGARAVTVTDFFSRSDVLPANDSIGDTEDPMTYHWSEGQLVFDNNVNAADIPGGYLRMLSSDRQVALNANFQDVPGFSVDTVFNVGAGDWPKTNATIFLRKGTILGGSFVWGENDGKVSIQFAPSGYLTIMENDSTAPGGLTTLYSQNPWTGATSWHADFGGPGSLPAILGGAPFDVDQDGRISAEPLSLETVTLGASLVGNSLKVYVNGALIRSETLAYSGSSTGQNYISLATNEIGGPASVVTNYDRFSIDSVSSLPVDRVFRWTQDATGSWTDPNNWTYSYPPSTNQDFAVFGSAITAPRTVAVNSAVTAKGVTFDNANSYTISGTGSVSLQADAGSASVFVTQGTHQFQTNVNLLSNTSAIVVGAATLELNGQLSLGGKTLTKTGAGVLNINNALNTDGGSIVVLDGSVGGGGSIGGDLTNTSGTVAPGVSPGKLSVQGNFSQAADGTFSVELGGHAAGTQYDQLAIAGAATLGGALDVSLIDLGSGVFAPALNDTFTILTALGGRTGIFTTTPAELPALGAGLAWQINYGTNNVTLSVVSAGLPGDFDSDGDVDGADFVAWQTHFPTASGATLADGDADGDGDVDGADFVVWQTHFPFTPGPGVATVPEPASVTLMFFSVAAISWRCYRRKK